MSTAVSVAREFVRLSFAGPEPDPLTGPRLQKLLYYAQAWHLALNGDPLFDERMRRGWMGPQFPLCMECTNHGRGNPFTTTSNWRALTFQTISRPILRK